MGHFKRYVTSSCSFDANAAPDFYVSLAMVAAARGGAVGEMRS
jgi:hypothetical protein